MEPRKHASRCHATASALPCQDGRVEVLAAVIGGETGGAAGKVVRCRIGAFDQRLTGSRELAMIAPS